MKQRVEAFADFPVGSLLPLISETYGTRELGKFCDVLCRFGNATSRETMFAITIWNMCVYEFL